MGVWGTRFKSHKLKPLLLLVFVIFLTISLIDSVYSQNEPLITVLEGEQEILLKFKKNDNPKIFELTLDEDSNQFDASVKIRALTLWDKERSKVIPGDTINFTLNGGTDAKTGFTISKSNSATIIVKVDPKGIEPGSYSGKIIISYGNSSDNITSNIVIPLKIQVGDTVWLAFGLLSVGVLLGAATNLVKKKNGGVSGKSITESISESIKNNFKPFMAGLLVVVLLLLTSLVLYYPRLADFGADPLFDYVVTILFGFGQYGSGKVTSDTVSRIVS